MKREVVRDEFIKKRMERQRKIRKRRLIVFFIIFIILLLCTGVALSLTVFFPIEKVTVTGSKIYSAEEILKASKISKGDNLFVVNEDKTQIAIKKKLPFIESISFKREIPDTLKITVKDAVEFACYKVGEKYYTVSSTGWVLEENTEMPENLLNIVCDVRCKVGSEIVFEDATQKELVNSITTAFKEKNINVSLIDVSDSSIMLKVENRFEVNLGNANYVNEKINHLEGMLKKIPSEKRGKINLSMWTNDNTKGTFIAEND